MGKYRISKYDPKFRNDKGIFEKNEWTSYSDIGKQYGEQILYKEDYMKMETKYCSVIISILNQCDVDKLVISDLELYDSWSNIRKRFLEKGLEPTKIEEKIMKTIKNGKEINTENIEEYFRLNLRESFWCIFSDKREKICIKFGYDYYVYIFCGVIDEEFIAKCKQWGIFIELLK